MLNNYFSNAGWIVPVISQYDDIPQGTLVMLIKQATGYQLKDQDKVGWCCRIVQLPTDVRPKSGSNMPVTRITVGNEFNIPSTYLGAPLKEEQVSVYKRIFAGNYKKADLLPIIIAKYGILKNSKEKEFYLKLSQFLRYSLNVGPGDHISFFADETNMSHFIGVYPKGVKLGIPVEEKGIIKNPLTAKSAIDFFPLMTNHTSREILQDAGFTGSSSKHKFGVMFVDTMWRQTDSDMPGVNLYKLYPSYEYLFARLGKLNHSRNSKNNHYESLWNTILGFMADHVNFNPDAPDVSRISDILSYAREGVRNAHPLHPFVIGSEKYEEIIASLASEED